MATPSTKGYKRVNGVDSQGESYYVYVKSGDGTAELAAVKAKRDRKAAKSAKNGTVSHVHGDNCDHDSV